MSWLYSRALVEEYSVDTCLDGAQSALSSGTPTLQASWLPAKMTEPYRLSRSGMTFKHLTGDLGEAVLMSFLEGFPAKTFQQQEKAQESQGNGLECGSTWQGSFTKYDRDSAFWKTHQCSLLGGLESFLGTWPKWGSMRNGACWERPTLEHRTEERGSGFWPTPYATDYKGSGKTGKLRDRLDYAVERGATKTKTWPTPCAGDYRSPNLNPCKNGQKIKPASEHSLPTKAGGQLNPDWVEWLMGWPIGWTALNALETDKFQQWRRLHLNYCQTE